jgi:hypothetical protein
LALELLKLIEIMWVEIKSDIFEKKYDIDELRKLIQDLLYKSKYYLLIDKTKVPKEIFENFSQTSNEAIEGNFNKFMLESPVISYFVTNSHVNKKCYSLDEAITYFSLQFLILLENNDNDGKFLDALFREFKKASRRINHFKNNFWIKYVNCGGSGNVIHTINAELSNVSNNEKLLKCFVLIDSDLEYAGQNSKNDRLIQFLESKQIAYHVLEKREVENYLPTNIFYNIDPSNKFIKAYATLNEAQKDFIDIEKGLKKSKSTLEKDHIEIHNFFCDITKTNEEENQKFNDLRHGITSLFNNFKNEYLELFNLSTQEGLIDRTKNQNNPNELKLILEKITKEL